jgi:hypothetical protein
VTTPIYHITHINNLDNILKHSGLKSCADIHSQRLNYTNIAHQTIQDRRAQFRVPLHPNGVVHDYVPFYFAPRSPMLYTISKGNVEGYSEGQSKVIYLVSTAERVAQSGYFYVFTDGHAIMCLSEYYNDLKDLEHIDWKVMNSQFWNDTADDRDRKRRRQAEFLVYKMFYIKDVIGIATYNDDIKGIVYTKLQTAGYNNIRVNIKPRWYY